MLSARSSALRLATGILLLLFAGGWASAQEEGAVKTLTEDQQAHKDCAGCHVNVTPGIVKQHLDSPHANTKRASDEVRCHDCHGTGHTTMDDYAKAEMPTAETCGECHKKQMNQHKDGKHNLGWMVMKSQIAWHGQPGAITEQGYRGCSGCHKIGEKGLQGVTDGNMDAKLVKDNGEEAAALPSGNYIDVDDDPQWVLDRALILQAAGILDESFQPTERFVEIVVQAQAARGPEEFNAIRTKMKDNCKKCHAKGFVDEHMKASDEIIKAADHEFAKAIVAVQGLYKDGILEKPEGWTFAPDLLQYYEATTKIEQELCLIMREYRQRTFQGAFHASNDYMHWYGWAPLKTAVNTILEEEKRLRKEHAAKAQAAVAGM